MDSRLPPSAEEGSQSPMDQGEEWSLDPEALYENMLAYQERQQGILNAVEGSAESGSCVIKRAQAFRPLCAMSYLYEMNSGWAVDSSGGWDFKDYETYADLVDRSEENGGTNYLLEAVESRLEGKETLCSSWRNEVRRAELPPDKFIEDKILPLEQYLAHYQQPFHQAYQTLEELSFRKKPTAKRPSTGASKFIPPARTGAAGYHGGTAQESTLQINRYDAAPARSQSGSGPETDLHPAFQETLPAPKIRTAREELLAASSQERNQAGANGSTTISGLRQPKDPFVVPVQTPTQDSATAQPRILDKRLQHLPPKMVEVIEREIVDMAGVQFTDLAGLDEIKKTLRQCVVLPISNPKLCVGLLSPPKGLLLFGPPGTGKTLIGKWIASSLKATFFAVTPATLTSKWFGEGEKMVRTLFEVARTRLPAIVFIDEVDSLLGQRKNDESEGTIRMKTEFLVQMDGLNTATEERLLVIGATNRPQEIDEAARRRFAHRLYVPLPKKDARRQIIVKQLAANAHALTVDNLERIAEKTEGFSGSDMVNLCKCACSLMLDKFLEGREDSSLEYISDEQLSPITVEDFEEAIQQCSPSVSQAGVQSYVDWYKLFGTGKK